MDTVIQSLLGIAVSVALSGCLVKMPPGVEVMPETETAKAADWDERYLNGTIAANDYAGGDTCKQGSLQCVR